MKTRFKHWKWRDMPWIIIGVIIVQVAIWHVSSKIDWPSAGYPAHVETDR